MKKLLISVVLLTAVLLIVGCSDSGGASSESGSSVEVKGLEEAFAEKPILLTSAGQSADAQMLNVAAGKAGLTCELDALIKADEFDADAYKTIVFAVGGSSKALGAAGIDKEQELKRCQEILEKAEDSCSIIVVHIGGAARRGQLSDLFIEEITPHADYILMLEGADDDGLFSSIAAENDIPMDVITSIADSGPKLAAAFK